MRVERPTWRFSFHRWFGDCRRKAPPAGNLFGRRHQIRLAVLIEVKRHQPMGEEGHGRHDHPDDERLHVRRNVGRDRRDAVHDVADSAAYLVAAAAPAASMTAHVAEAMALAGPISAFDTISGRIALRAGK